MDQFGDLGILTDISVLKKLLSNVFLYMILFFFFLRKYEKIRKSLFEFNFYFLNQHTILEILQTTL